MRKTNLPYFQNFPEDFMGEAQNAVISSVKKNKNAQLVAPRGSGKSLFLRSLLKSKAFKENKIAVFYVDFKLIPERSSLAILSLILGSMKDWEISKGMTEGEMILEIQKSMDKFCEKGEKALFLFDSFENLTNIENSLVLNSLISVMDQNRDILNTIFCVEKKIILDSELGKIIGNTYYLKPLTRKDFDWFLDGLERGMSKKIAKEERDIIFDTTNGIAGLSKRLVEIVFASKKLEKIISNPEENIHLRYQIELLTESFNDDEIKKMYSCPLIDNFLQKNVQKDDCEDEVGEIKIAKRLTVSEHELLKVLNDQKGKIVSRDEIIESLWGENATRGISDHALDQLVHRLRNKLKKSDVVLETIRGRGHKLSW